ncbi:hypothetical protein LUCX_325 [Xanthomonas phage vB_XciM_LucasX]|nr:hypothetical protein LUCX_325 [Xanthomonas phage vB_XciM_LucasX]
MSLKNHFKKAPKMRPQLNIGSVFDIPNGRYYLGKHGESVLNGGVAFFTGVAGRGNTFKSTLMHYMTLAILDRYSSSVSNIYDTEMSLTAERMYQLAQHMDNIAGVDLEAEDRMLITDSTAMMGEEWFDALKAHGADLISKEKIKANTRTTPFINHETGGFFTSIAPTVVEIDSLSMLTTTAVQQVFDKSEIGDSSTNMSAMTDARIKTQMINQFPAFTAAHGIYVMTSAHVGKQHVMDKYAPPAKQLMFLKGDNSFKNVPEKFSFLTNNLYFVHSAEILLNADKSGCEFPKDSDDKRKGDTDLQLLTVQNLRAKSGPTGMPIEVIVSQNEGVHMGLTEFNLIKNLGRFGLDGNMQNYALTLLPDVSLSRTTVRGKLDNNPKLRRAMEITAELAYMYNFGYRTENTVDKPEALGEEEVLDRDLSCTAKELYEDLKAKGYDWDVLLATRGYWVFQEDEKDRPPFLSTMDLLRMRAGLYHPYWMPKPTPATTDQKVNDAIAAIGAKAKKPVTA